MSKPIKITVIIISLMVCLALFFGGGYVLGTRTPPSPDQNLALAEEVWDVIFRDYVDLDRLDANALSQGAVKGMVEALDDPYTAYLNTENYQQWISNLEGKYDGIGAYVGIKDEQIMIIAPIPDSPADKAGIRAGDIILEINGSPTLEMNMAEAILNIRGPKGTPVRLLILHQDDTAPEEIEIVRAEIELPSVRFEMKGDIAYINVSHFSERTDEELSPVLQSITKEAATGIILDLRRNSGGLLHTVIDVASRFLSKGVVIYVVDNQGNKTASMVKNRGATTDLPLVVLVDKYSASGSEVLAGALQDYKRATIAGTITHGKGSVNTLRRLRDGSGLYITTARWLTPDGRLIEGEGIEPDYLLELEGEDAIQWAIDYLKSQ